MSHPEPAALPARPARPALGQALRAGLYDALASVVAGALLPAAALLHPKLAAYRRARRYWREILEADLARRPDVAAGDAIWVHGASAGEFLQARALLAALRERFPARPLVYTYTSPSALPLVERFRGADLVFPLPSDTRANARVWLDAIRPAALALVDAELWPAHVGESQRRGIPVAAVSARLEPGSPRLRFPARAIQRDLLRDIACVGAVDAATAALFRAAGAPSERVFVGGDLRVDETLRRAAEITHGPELPLPGILPVVVAGSTWPDDEAVLLPALERLRDRGVFLALAIAPHEVHEERVRGLERALVERGFTPARWSRASSAPAADWTAPADDWAAPALGWTAPAAHPGGLPAPAARPVKPGGAMPIGDREATAAGVDALLIDGVGSLHRCYALASVAYVGGGFRGALHNVMEPAAFGVPVVTGPRTRRSWAAEEMVEACGLFPVADAEACATAIGHALSGREPRGAGAKAQGVLLAHAGAVGRTLAALEGTGWMPQAEAGSATSPRNRSGGTLSS